MIKKRSTLSAAVNGPGDPPAKGSAPKVPQKIMDEKKRQESSGTFQTRHKVTLTDPRYPNAKSSGEILVGRGERVPQKMTVEEYNKTPKQKKG